MTTAKVESTNTGDPNERDVVGLTGVENLSAEAVLGGDEFADDGAGQRRARYSPAAPK